MKELSSLVFLYAESPLHAGSGAALGAVDLPIQRERLSGFPLVQGSGIKGALRAELNAHHKREDGSTSKEWEPLDRALFGREPPRGGESGQDERANDKAGALSVLDARLLLLPVRTVWGGFAWVTCPMILERLKRDLEVAEVTSLSVSVPKIDDSTAFMTKTSSVSKGKSFVIEDFEYEAKTEDWVDELANWLAQNALPETKGYGPFRARLATQLAVVSDAEMKALSERATEVVTRVRIDEKTGTVAQSALWTEESLPAETLLWSIGFFAKERPKRGDVTEGKADGREPSELRKTLGDKLKEMSRIRLGGDRTTGRGIVGIRLTQGGKS